MVETLEFVNETFPWFFTIASFIFGCIVGSFLNVCIYRIPAERSIVFPGSTCACGQPIAWYHNIPILSWSLLRGRASCCGTRFSVRYPAIEFLTGLLFYASWQAHTPVVALLGMWFIAFLICATFIDLDHMIIPDRFSIGGMVLGVMLSIAFPMLHGIEGGMPIARNIESGVISVTGALVGAGLVYWIAVLGEIVFRKPAMGEGDVKFVGFIGAVCGWQGAVFSMFGGALIGSLVLIPLLALGRIFGWKVKSKLYDDEGNETGEELVQFGSQVPFGPMLAVGGLFYFLGLDHFVDAYFAEIVLQFFGN